MLSNTSKWSHARGNTVVPSRWQVTGAVVVGNAMHWMEEPSALQACASYCLLWCGRGRDRGPPRWLGNAPGSSGCGGSLRISWHSSSAVLMLR